MKLWSKDRSLHLRAFPLPFLTPSPQQRLYVQNELHWSHTYPKIVPSLEHSIVRRFGKGTVLVIIRSNTNWTTENEVKTLGHVTFSNNHSPSTKTVKKKSNQSKRWNTICYVELHYGNVWWTLSPLLSTSFPEAAILLYSDGDHSPLEECKLGRLWLACKKQERPLPHPLDKSNVGSGDKISLLLAITRLRTKMGPVSGKSR